MKNKNPVIIAVCLLAFAVALAMVVGSRQEPLVGDLPDGTSFRLALVAHTNTFTYSRRYLPDWVRPLAPLIPDSIEKKFLLGGGSIGLGSSAETNLMLVVEAVNERAEPTTVGWLRISDNQGNIFDGNTTRGMLSGGDRRSLVYVATVLPNRSKELFVEPLAQLEDRSWTNVGPFKITNPNSGDFPQWTPEPIPQEARDGNISATLVRFETGTASKSFNGKASPSKAMMRSVLLDFEFAETGKLNGRFRPQQITISDATGNKWTPFVRRPTTAGESLSRNHQSVELAGGLWPGEDAWKIKLSVLRIAGFSSNEVWQVPMIKLPASGTSTALTNTFFIDDETNRLATILAPGVEVTDRWQWIVRYWGKEKNVFGLGLECLPIFHRRPIILEATNENGTAFNVVQHTGENSPLQALFLQPPDEGATELHLTIAFPELKTFSFLARPEFVEQVQLPDQ